MILRLYDGAWSDIIEGLDLQADACEDGNPDYAKLVRQLIESLEELGEERLGGTVEGYQLIAEAKRRKFTVEIRVVEG